MHYVASEEVVLLVHVCSTAKATRGDHAIATSHAMPSPDHLPPISLPICVILTIQKLRDDAESDHGEYML